MRICSLRRPLWHRRPVISVGWLNVRKSLTTESGLRQIGPLSEYFRLVSEKRLRPDEDQMRTIVELQRLCEDLLDYEPPELSDLSEQSPVTLLARSAIVTPNDESRDVVRLADEEEVHGPKGLWIHGEVGTGKTMAMDLFYESVPIQRKKRVHFNAFTVSAFARIHEWNKRSRPNNLHVTELVARDLFRDSWLLCFDEFQITDVATASVMRQVFKNMFKLGAVMVATSNRAPEDLYKGGFHREYHSPFVDLLKERCEILHLRGKVDYRSEMLKEHPTPRTDDTYFRLDNPAEVDAFIERVSNLFYGQQIKRDKLTLYGREVIVPKAADGKALYTFEELCGSEGKPLGPADYLLICQRYHTIVVQSVPRMGLAQKNEARRFITFIDAAYENGVTVIISADHSPESLFLTTKDPVDEETADAFMHKEMLGDLMGSTRRGTGMKEAGEDRLSGLAIFTGAEEQFAFKRAVSRLLEMRSQLWTSRVHSPVKVDFSPAVTGLPGECQPSPTHPTSLPSVGNVTLSPYYDPRHDKIQGDDFGDEASYRGYLKMYQRFNPDEGPVKLDRESQKPRFPDRHFWAMGDWGPRAGKWGQGVRAFFGGKKREGSEGEEGR
ncbi:uncharacterized protein SPPG_04585 [Spizellomyces punctatus DAOM BR117]|uniref:AFG1-like ATPase n=1 Tax=Spizellomyces punctatus (strain DAOM BR117) TaxID=645134 RepID=A0A0L0HHG7_SPIPD|nr:uncharacterized protein SPPG_04585 [Spizellomyces punctatus DAOM BR117]KND00254.1 hypothetical protein SPPG_04585 [Spizellomyces punctatus DAOM BR117]|eukprot:XP_016608293.1 hypothetical protein SPPG_04585 [Spizellomyces punctatus DAOM BR117]